MFGVDWNKVCSGEGLMFWDQTAQWELRGGGMRSTHSILKYKPRALSVGIVTTIEPDHTHRSRRNTADGDTDDALPGYTIGLDWWDVMSGQWVKLRPFVSPNYGAARCATEFALDQSVFFTFVMYDRKPHFLRALGTHLSQWDAVSVKTGLEQRSGNVTLTSGEAHQLLRTVDDIRTASAWHNGDVCVLFPTTVSWSLHDWLLASQRGSRRRLSASPALNPDIEWHAKTTSAITAMMRAVVDREKAEQGVRDETMHCHVPVPVHVPAHGGLLQHTDVEGLVETSHSLSESLLDVCTVSGGGLESTPDQHGGLVEFFHGRTPSGIANAMGSVSYLDPVEGERAGAMGGGSVARAPVHDGCGVASIWRRVSSQRFALDGSEPTRDLLRYIGEACVTIRWNAPGFSTPVT